VALAEMALLGELVRSNRTERCSHPLAARDRLEEILLFSESNTRFVCEVPPENAERFAELLAEIPCGANRRVTDKQQLEIFGLQAAPNGRGSCGPTSRNLKPRGSSQLDW